MSKLILMLTVIAGAALVAPSPVAAEDCTREYMQCLNDTYDLDGWLQTLADIECFAIYTGCVARAVIVE
jgi:hypothetical protein